MKQLLRSLRIVITLGVIAVLLAQLGAAPAQAAAGGNIFRGLTTTAGGFPTWDSDMINIERVTQTGKGVYVAVLDTGLAPNWRDYFPEARVATNLGTGFDQPISIKTTSDPCGLSVEVGQLSQSTWIGARGVTHGTHVASTILGYFYDSNYDTAAGVPLPPLVVRGIAPDVTLIPVKVVSEHQVPALPKCQHPGPQPAQTIVNGTNAMVTAGINYVTDLAIAGYRPMVINMSLGSTEPLDSSVTAAIDRALANGVIIVASAGNEGDAGMGYPGAYSPVISAGASGWTKEWLHHDDGLPFYRLWWLQSNYYPYNDIPEPAPTNQVYVTSFSSRELPGQQLDVLAPGSVVRGPAPGSLQGYGHLPWWSKGIGDLVSGHPNNFVYASGTSMAAPHVTSIAALLLQKKPTLTQVQIESILKSTALPITPGSATVYDMCPEEGFCTHSWGSDATGAGLVQADAALNAVP